MKWECLNGRWGWTDTNVPRKKKIEMGICVVCNERIHNPTGEVCDGCNGTKVPAVCVSRRVESGEIQYHGGRFNQGEW